MLVQWDSQTLLNPSKLFLKLQSLILNFVGNNTVGITTYARIVRLYADLGITQSSLFEDVNNRSDQFSQMDEEGFCHLLISLKMHQMVSKTPKIYRGSIADLEQVLTQNLDLIPQTNSIDILFCYVMVNFRE